jgi:hypothetical protein
VGRWRGWRAGGGYGATTGSNNRSLKLDLETHGRKLDQYFESLAAQLGRQQEAGEADQTTEQMAKQL